METARVPDGRKDTNVSFTLKFLSYLDWSSAPIALKPCLSRNVMNEFFPYSNA